MQIKLEQESRLLTACLPAPPLLALLLACLTALAAFHLSLRRSHSSLSLARAAFALSYSEIKAKKGTRRRRRRRCRRRRRSRKTSKTFLFSFGAFQIIFD